jgi:hypothetical protein
METTAIRVIIGVLASLGLLWQIPASERQNEASEAVLYVPASLPTFPPSSTTTTIPLVGWVDNCEDVLELALRAGWPPELLAHLGRIAWRESGCKSWAFNRTDTAGGSRGILQINGAHTALTDWNPEGWLQSQRIGIHDEDDLFNAELNLRAGWALYQYAEQYYGDGWQPWNATRDRN